MAVTGPRLEQRAGVLLCIIDVNADAPTVFAVLADVDRWPEWTPTMTSVRRESTDPLRVGESVRVRQPRLPDASWRVTELDPPRSFTWVTSRTGLTTEAGHRVEEIPGGVRVTLSLWHTGPLARLARLVGGSLVRRYVQTEATSLKSRCESR